jgi:hypothetical protein
MMLLWSIIIATLVGLTSAAAFPRDLGFQTLSQTQIDSTNTYAHYAAAVKCGPQNLTNWKCGRAYLTCGPFFHVEGNMGWNARWASSDTLLSFVQFIAMRIPISRYS